LKIPETGQEDELFRSAHEQFWILLLSVGDALEYCRIEWKASQQCVLSIGRRWIEPVQV
jgi:hypothetical protein